MKRTNKYVNNEIYAVCILIFWINHEDNILHMSFLPSYYFFYGLFLLRN